MSAHTTTGFEAVPFPKVKIRDAHPDEFKKILDAADKVGMFIPQPGMASSIVAEDEGEIVGFAFAQYILHPEPIYVMPRYRGTSVARELAEAVRDKIGSRPCVAVAQNPFAEQLCRDMGMVEVPGKIFVQKG